MDRDLLNDDQLSIVNGGKWVRHPDPPWWPKHDIADRLFVKYAKAIDAPHLF